MRLWSITAVCADDAACSWQESAFARGGGAMQLQSSELEANMERQHDEAKAELLQQQADNKAEMAKKDASRNPRAGFTGSGRKEIRVLSVHRGSLWKSCCGDTQLRLRRGALTGLVCSAAEQLPWTKSEAAAVCDATAAATGWSIAYSM
jgi:hypothetical protein